jgi:hypothetical protein
MLISPTLERGDPEKRPILTRIYGMVGCLIVSCALIVLLVILQRKLPDGSNSTFHIPVRRHVESPRLGHEVVRREKNVLKGTCASPFPGVRLLSANSREKSRDSSCSTRTEDNASSNLHSRTYFPWFKSWLLQHAGQLRHKYLPR